MASVDTREAQRDTHLKSADFLDAEQYPHITFSSDEVKAVSATEFEVRGPLSIHGITKEVNFRAHVEGAGKDPWGNNRIAYSATLRINREDFGLTWNQALETGGFLVSKEIEIELEIQALPAA